VLDLLDILGVLAAAGPGSRDRVTDLLITLSIVVWPLLAAGAVMWLAGSEPDRFPVAVAITLSGGASAASVRYAGRGTAAAVLAALGSAAAAFCAFFLIAFAVAILTFF
jgi:hypothetical protein